MSKKRTKKQKQNTKYTFAYKIINEAKNFNFEPTVKGQIKNTIKGTSKGIGLRKNAEPTAKDSYQGYIRKDIRKSLIIVSLILALEVVIYLAWL
ncbi:MAG: hypothetical protein ABIJ05_01740 [Patescibacteria group bacterium]